MNREILFRGKRVDNGKWVYGYFIESESDLYRAYIVTSARWETNEDGDTDLLETYTYEVDPSTVGQYTGLPDKNGVKIFEGDIVTATYLDHVYIGTVEYDQAAFWISWQRDCEGRAFSGPSCAIYPIEVIGNIYDNSDMLTEVE